MSRAIALYRRYPLLFLALAAGVIVPYETVVLLITGTGPFTQSSLGFGSSLLLTLIDWLVVGPLVSALHVHAVADTRDDRDPQLSSVALRGLRVLPVVVAASIISALGTAVGFLFLIVPGILLTLRWIVVAQTRDRARGLVASTSPQRRVDRGNYGKLILFALYLGLIVTVPSFAISLAFSHTTTTAASFVVGVAVRVLASSFAALATAQLYFELRAREEQRRAAGSAPSPVDDTSAASGQALDPRRYSDQNRPKGWYIDPATPGQMRYWHDGDASGWTGKSRTPRKLRKAWKEEVGDETSGGLR